MNCFVYLVKPVFFSLHSATCAVFCEGANYSKRAMILSNIINHNIDALMHILGKRQEFTHFVRLRHIQRIPFRRSSGGADFRYQRMQLV